MIWCKLVIEENTVYEIDEECAARRRKNGQRGRKPGSCRDGVLAQSDSKKK